MNNKPKENDICPHCGGDKLVLIPELEPWYTDHLQCPKCDSTYNLEED